jgi:hypothetical protein
VLTETSVAIRLPKTSVNQRLPSGPAPQHGHGRHDCEHQPAAQRQEDAAYDRDAGPLIMYAGIHSAPPVVENRYPQLLSRHNLRCDPRHRAQPSWAFGSLSSNCWTEPSPKLDKRRERDSIRCR